MYIEKLLKRFILKGIVSEEEVLYAASNIMENNMKSSQDVLSSPDTVRDFLKSRIGNRECELFCVLYLDNRHRFICFDEVFRGTINGASVHPREVAKDALKYSAAAVILAHNHPSGETLPSEADRHITNRLKQALEVLDIRVLDHVIVGGGNAYSFAESGLI